MKWTWAPRWCMGPPAPGLRGPLAAAYVALLPDSALIWGQSGRRHKSIFTLSRSVEESRIFGELLRQYIVIDYVKSIWMTSLKLQHLTLFLCFCSPVLMVLWLVSQTQARDWWSGGLTSTSGPARRSSRYETLHLHLLRDSLDSVQGS